MYRLSQSIASNWQQWSSFLSSKWEINERFAKSREESEDEVGWPWKSLTQLFILKIILHSEYVVQSVHLISLHYYMTTYTYTAIHAINVKGYLHTYHINSKELPYISNDLNFPITHSQIIETSTAAWTSYSSIVFLFLPHFFYLNPWPFNLILTFSLLVLNHKVTPGQDR